MKCSKDTINYSIDSKVRQRILPFSSSIQKLTNNLNAIQSTSSKKSIDLDSINKPSLDTNEQSSNLTFIEQKQIQLSVNNLINIGRKSIVKSSYQIPSPTILLPDEFPSSSKPIPNNNTIINKIQRSTPIDLLTFNQPNSFHLKTHSINNTEELIINSEKTSATSINSLNLTQLSDNEEFPMNKSDQNSISSSQKNLSMKQSSIILPRFIDKPILSNRSIPNPRISSHDIPNKPTSIVSQDLKSPPFKLLRDKIDNENIPFELPTDTSPFEISPQIKIRHEIKPESESLWKTKLSLKTVLSIANRDEAQALKNRKPIDYHMFLSNKLNKNSILQYDDHIDTKFTANNKQTIIEQFNEQDYTENRKLYKRLLNTMGLRKSINIKNTESMTSIKQIQTKRRTKMTPSTIIQENIFPSFDNSIHETEKPVLITYQAIPISLFNK